MPHTKPNASQHQEALKDWSLVVKDPDHKAQNRRFPGNAAGKPVAKSSPESKVTDINSMIELKSYQTKLMVLVNDNHFFDSQKKTSPAYNFKKAIESAKTLKHIGDAFRNVIALASKDMDPQHAEQYNKHIKDFISESETLGSFLQRLQKEFPDVIANTSLLKNVIEILDNFFKLAPNAKGITFTGGAYSHLVIVNAHGEGAGPASTATAEPDINSDERVVTAIEAEGYMHVLTPKARTSAPYVPAAQPAPQQQAEVADENYSFDLFSSADAKTPLSSTSIKPKP